TASRARTWPTRRRCVAPCRRLTACFASRRKRRTSSSQSGAGPAAPASAEKPRPWHRTWTEAIPNSVSIETLPLGDVAAWHTDDLATSRAYGDRWLAEQRTGILLVPSVIVPTEYDVLINPSHADFDRLVASLPRPVNWDKRLRAVTTKGGH